MKNQIRVRFAPSPTGMLHIGGIRTALFNFLFARKEKGTFLLRIEDTDRERSKPEYEVEISNALKWLGLTWDEPVVRQSDRLKLYQDAVCDLVQKGMAYSVDEGGRSAIRFKVEKKKVRFCDLVHGEIEFDTTLFDDFVIQKSDGFPTYLFACVIDDHLMNVSHVIRGDDHISNTPRQILIYESFGWQPPSFGHLPLVFGPDKTPLSKRHGTVSFDAYRRSGYLPHGLLNYLALLGWSPGKNKELMSLKEMTEEFSFEQVHSTNACFDLEKLKWLNGEHVRQMNDNEYVEWAAEYFKMYHNEIYSKINRHFPKIAVLYKARMRIFEELPEQVSFFAEEPTTFDPSILKKHLSEARLPELMGRLRDAFYSEGNFESPADLEVLLRKVAAELHAEARVLIHPTRYAISGRTVTPSLFDILAILGKEIVVKRLDFVIQHYKALTRAEENK